MQVASRNHGRENGAKVGGGVQLFLRLGGSLMGGGEREVRVLSPCVTFRVVFRRDPQRKKGSFLPPPPSTHPFFRWTYTEGGWLPFYGLLTTRQVLFCSWPNPPSASVRTQAGLCVARARGLLLCLTFSEWQTHPLDRRGRDRGEHKAGFGSARKGSNKAKAHPYTRECFARGKRALLCFLVSTSSAEQGR